MKKGNNKWTIEISESVYRKYLAWNCGVKFANEKMKNIKKGKVIDIVNDSLPIFHKNLETKREAQRLLETIIMANAFIEGKLRHHSFAGGYWKIEKN
jgi:hypothetical protein